MLPCCQQGSMPGVPGWRARHMHMPAHARSCPAQELPLCAAGGHRWSGIDSLRIGRPCVDAPADDVARL
jgi:hypothetical protein